MGSIPKFLKAAALPIKAGSALLSIVLLESLLKASPVVEKVVGFQYKYLGGMVF